MDFSLFHAINQFAIHTPWAHGVMRLIAIYGVGVFAPAVLLAWWLARREDGDPIGPAAAFNAAVGTLIAVAANQPIANAVQRLRPYVTHRGVEVLVARSTDYSFPSDHAVTAGSAAFGLVLVAWSARRGHLPVRRSRLLRVLAVLGGVAALIVTFSRVYVGAHYPGDVVAGLIVGATINALVWIVLRRPLIQLVTIAGSLPVLRALVRA